MAGLAGLTEAEKAIYDEFESVTRGALEKARSAAKAIGTDLESIIGPTEAAVVKDAKAIASTAMKWWEYLLHFLDFLDDPRNGKFSHKRLIAVGAAVVGIRQLIIGDKLGALGCGITAVVLAVISAVTKT